MEKKSNVYKLGVRVGVTPRRYDYIEKPVESTHKEILLKLKLISKAVRYIKIHCISIC